MNMKKTGKVLVLLGASAALIASLVNDKKTKAQGENNNQVTEKIKSYIINSNMTGSKKINKSKCNILTKTQKMHTIILRQIL